MWLLIETHVARAIEPRHRVTVARGPGACPGVLVGLSVPHVFGEKSATVGSYTRLGL